jgi:NAD(P)-dependent dehydrogenase (short-subunit alcohol dehydrogenase family)
MTGRIAVITGAAAGIGQATARAFLSHDWSVLGLDMDETGLRSMEERSGGRFLGVVCDVASRQEVEAAVARLPELDGGLWACLNIAGTFPPSRLSEYDLEAYRAAFDSSVLGTVNVTAACAPLLALVGGVVVNTASTAAFVPPIFHMFYAAAKAAVVSLTRSFALELAPDGVRVNAIAPGYTRTERVIANGRMDGFEATVPLGRAAAPDEIAEIFWTIAGEDRFAYMTGETIMVSGGTPMR